MICLSVNDAFVMFQWAKHLGVKNVFMLPDGNGDFTRQMNMLVTKVLSAPFGVHSHITPLFPSPHYHLMSHRVRTLSCPCSCFITAPLLLG